MVKKDGMILEHPSLRVRKFSAPCKGNRVKKNPKDYLLFFILYIPTDQDTSSLTPNAHLLEYDSPLSLNSQ